MQKNKLVSAMRFLVTQVLMVIALTTVTESKRHREDDSRQCSSDICNLGDKCVFKCFCDMRINVTDCFIFNGNISSTSEIWETFSPKPYLQTLSLKVTGTGALKEIPSKAIQRLDSLTNLTIKFAPIKTLSSNAFANSKSLREIYLIGNQISKLETYSISSLPNLVTLVLEENEISELEGEVFVHLPNLRKLSLSFNNLTLIHEGCFKNLTQLLELYLYANDISTLTSENFQGLINLEVLDLSRNEIKILGNYVFFEAKHLKILLLGENKLEMLSPMAFSGLMKLERISVANNRIQWLDPRMFRGIHRLISVDLRNNKLLNLTTETVSPIVNNIERYDRGYLRLDGNPLSCDCTLFWIYNVVKTTRNYQLRQCISNITCLAEPQLLRQLISVIITQPPKPIRGRIYYNTIKEKDMRQDQEMKPVKVVEIPMDMLPCPFHMTDKDELLEPTLNEVKDNTSSSSTFKLTLAAIPTVVIGVMVT